MVLRTRGTFSTTRQRFLYVKNRVQLNHSKASKNKKIPFNPNDEWEVQVSLPLAELVAKSLTSYEDTHLIP